jgi:hypothetical protein
MMSITLLYAAKIANGMCCSLEVVMRNTNGRKVCSDNLLQEVCRHSMWTCIMQSTTAGPEAPQALGKHDPVWLLWLCHLN